MAELVCKCGKIFLSKQAIGVHITKKHLPHQSEASAKQKLRDKFIRGHRSAGGQVKVKLVRPRLTTKEIQSLPIVCFCGLTFPSKEALDEHVTKRHTRQNLEGISFNSSESEMYYSQENEQMEKPRLPTTEEVLRMFDERRYACGCDRTYECSERLMQHINKAHEGIPPEGTIFGIKKRIGTKLKPLYYEDDKDAEEELNRKYILKRRTYALKKCIFKCGCGEIYSAQTALKVHIRDMHDSLVPNGTSGLHLSRRSSRGEYTRFTGVCRTCFKSCRKCWKCSGCGKGVWCGECEEGNTELEGHIRMGHRLIELQ